MRAPSLGCAGASATHGVRKPSVSAGGAQSEVPRWRWRPCGYQAAGPRLRAGSPGRRGPEPQTKACTARAPGARYVISARELALPPVRAPQCLLTPSASA